MDLARSDPAADIAEDVRDVLSDQRQRADRQNSDQGKDQRVLDKRLTLLPVPEACQGHQSLRLDELEHLWFSFRGSAPPADTRTVPHRLLLAHSFVGPPPTLVPLMSYPQAADQLFR